MNLILNRLRMPIRANQSLPMALNPEERAAMIGTAAGLIGELLDVLRIDHRDDHNTRDTPERVARMLVEELLAGRFSPPPAITAFDNVAGFDQLLVTGPIAVRSTCAHHLMPIHGEAFIGVLPSASGAIIGLSKYDRIVDYFARRLQIQEELVKQIGQFIMDRTQPCGLAVRISAIHFCKTHRGVRAGERGRMITTAYFGAFDHDPELRRDFQRECLAFGQTG